MKVKGRSAVVTGAAGGIGAALATELRRRGARPLLADLSPAVVNTARRIDSPHWVGDVASVEGVAELLEAARNHLGEVDLYFANAGITGPAGLGTSDEEWEPILEVNLRAHVRAAQALIPQWQKAGAGHFVATSSAAGLLTQIGSAAYSVTKHAAIGFAEWLNVSYHDDGIRSSVISPMGVNTQLLATIGDSAAKDAVTGAGRVLEPQEVAEVALDGVENDDFLILPHPEVLDMYRMKGSDYDRWLRGMSRYQRTLNNSISATPSDTTRDNE